MADDAAKRGRPKSGNPRAFPVQSSLTRLEAEALDRLRWKLSKGDERTITVAEAIRRAILLTDSATG
jgi:hypothetical protein